MAFLIINFENQNVPKDNIQRIFQNNASVEDQFLGLILFPLLPFIGFAFWTHFRPC